MIGAFECRLQPDTIKLLGERFEKMKRRPFFTIKDTHRNGPEPAVSVSLEGVVEKMKNDGEFRIYRSIEVTNELAETEILLHIRQKGQVISGFPRRLKDDGDDGKSSLTLLPLVNSILKLNVSRHLRGC